MHLGGITLQRGNVSLAEAGGGASGAVVERDSYDAWGKRRNPNGMDDINGTLRSQTTRGFTGHEHIQDVGLINMNARIYDPLTGRFLSPDPVSQAGNLQDFNPYSYVGNNPLSLTDPSGTCKGILGCIVDFLPAIAAIVVAVYAPELLGALEGAVFGTSFGTAANVVIAGAAAGAISSGGNLQAIGISAITAGAFYGIGVATDAGAKSAFGQLFGGSATAADIGQAAGDGLVGGLSSIAQGGSFQSGFLAAGFSSGAGEELSSVGAGYDNIISRSVTGGFASVLGGGKFLNGAVTGAFSYAYNNCRGSLNCIEQGLEDAGTKIEDGADFVVTHPVLSLEVVGTEVALGGPEDPLADAAVSAEIAAEEGLTTAEQLTAAAGRAVGTVGPGSGSVYGTLVHSAFSDEVINLGDSNLSSEISYLNGEVVPYGTSGSVRLDVVEGPLDAPTSIFDLKTGSATLTPGRILQIQNNIPGGTSVPVFPITPP